MTSYVSAKVEHPHLSPDHPRSLLSQTMRTLSTYALRAETLWVRSRLINSSINLLCMSLPNSQLIMHFVLPYPYPYPYPCLCDVNTGVIKMVGDAASEAGNITCYAPQQSTAQHPCTEIPSSSSSLPLCAFLCFEQLAVAILFCIYFVTSLTAS